MEQVQVRAEIREKINKGHNRRLRSQGGVPAVIYGGRQEPRNVMLDAHDMELILRGARHSSAVFSIAAGEGAEETTIIRDIQRHPVDEQLVHVDFMRVDVDKSIEMRVPIHIVGSDPLGVKKGGILEHAARAVTVLCKPLLVPKFIEMDASELDLNATFHVSDLTLPEGVNILDDPETPLISILAPKVVEEEVEETPEGEEVEGEEPEVIGEKKAEESEDKE